MVFLLIEIVITVELQAKLLDEAYMGQYHGKGPISNGNRTEWRTIRAVIGRMT